MFIEVSLFPDTSTALKNSWLWGCLVFQNAFLQMATDKQSRKQNIKL